MDAMTRLNGLTPYPADGNAKNARIMRYVTAKFRESAERNDLMSEADREYFRKEERLWASIASGYDDV